METPERPGPAQTLPRLQKDAYEGAQATRAAQGLQVIPTCSQGENRRLHREMAIPGEPMLLAFKQLVHFIWVIEFTGTELFTLVEFSYSSLNIQGISRDDHFFPGIGDLILSLLVSLARGLLVLLTFQVLLVFRLFKSFQIAGF